VFSCASWCGIIFGRDFQTPILFVAANRRSLFQNRRFAATK